MLYEVITGIKIQFSDEALMEIARKASHEQTGARGLVSIMEKILLPFEKKLPSTDIRFLSVTRELVRDPCNELERLLSDMDYLARHEDQYHRLYQEEHDRIKEMLLQKRGDFLVITSYSIHYTKLYDFATSRPAPATPSAPPATCSGSVPRSSTRRPRRSPTARRCARPRR